VIGRGHGRASLLLAALALLAACPGLQSADAGGGDSSDAGARDATVIWISMDGVRFDYPERAELAAFGRMAREGLRAERLIPVTPASTFPAHVAQATGAPVERHRIIANRFLDPERGEFDYSNDASWIGAEPIWVAAERQGVRSAVFFWVGSETDWNGRGATHRKAPFDARISERAKVEQILAWLDLPERQRPRLIMSWWHGADEVGHRLGPDAPEIADAMRKQDRELARLLRGLDERNLWKRTTLIVTSDHGMAAVERSIDLLETLRAAKIRARVRSSEGVAYVHLKRPEQIVEAVRALDALPGVEALPASRLPPDLRLGAGPRSGQVVGFTEPPLRFGAKPRGLRRLAGEPRGAHGSRGDLPEMGGIFFALGRGAPAGARIGAVSSLDLAASVSALLGIEAPADSAGRSQLPR
jgi:predicted AlkP superfamily pyrophosphatase or phosphodiesterase